MDPKDTRTPVAPATPAEPAPVAPAPTPPVDPTPAPVATPAPAAPAEGGTPAPAEPAPSPAPEPAPVAEPAPAQPRESAQQKRARELREKTSGMNALADRLDPPAPEIRAPQPVPPVATAPTPAPAQPSAVPDYFDPDTGEIDPIKMEAHNERRAAEIARGIVSQAKSDETLQTARRNYVDSVSRDATAIAAQYDELNPDKPESYDADLDDHIDAMYQAATRDAQGRVIRIDLPLKQFVDQEMKAIRKYRTATAAATPNLVAGQAVDGAPAPASGATPKTVEKPYEQMTRKEREAKLGYARVPTPPVK